MLNKIKNELYGIYRTYLLKRIDGDIAFNTIIDYSEAYEAQLTKYMNSLLVRLVLKLLLKINPKNPLLFRFLEGNIVDNSTTLPTRYYLFNVVKQHFPDELDNLEDYILRYLPYYFPSNLEFEGVDVIKAGFSQFLFLTYKTLNTYIHNQPFTWNHNFSGFSNNNILILKKANDTYSNEKYQIQYSYGDNKKMVILDGKQYFNEKKHSIPLIYIGFALHIYKLITINFDSAGIKLNFPSDQEIPIKVSYKDCDIILYIFKDSIVVQPKKNKEIKRVRGRMGVVDLNKRKFYVK